MAGGAGGSGDVQPRPGRPAKGRTRAPRGGDPARAGVIFGHFFAAASRRPWRPWRRDSRAAPDAGHPLTPRPARPARRIAWDPTARATFGACWGGAPSPTNPPPSGGPPGPKYLYGARRAWGPHRRAGVSHGTPGASRARKRRPRPARPPNSAPPSTQIFLTVVHGSLSSCTGGGGAGRAGPGPAGAPRGGQRRGLDRDGRPGARHGRQGAGDRLIRGRISGIFCLFCSWGVWAALAPRPGGFAGGAGHGASSHNPPRAASPKNRLGLDRPGHTRAIFGLFSPLLLIPKPSLLAHPFLEGATGGCNGP